MGLYNSHFPRIIGEEWVPIRNEDLQFSPAVSSVEMGYEFIHTNNTDSLSSGRYYIRKWPTRVPGASISLFLSQPFFVQLYAAGTEDQTGPINVVRIPVSSGTAGSGASLTNATSVQQALASPVDGRKIIMSATTTPIFGTVDMNFAMSTYNQLLQNKRIIAVNLIYNATQTTDPNTSYLTININGGQDVNYGLVTFDDQGVCRLGDTNWWFSTTTPGLSFPSPFPYTPVSIRRFEGTHASPITVTIEANSDEAVVEAAQWDLLYAALEVYYCEEKRLVMGGAINVNQGVNQVPLYKPLETSSGYTLDHGVYTVTLAAADTGDSRGDSTQSALLAQPYPSLNALRQLYENPMHRGVQVNHPSPVGTNIIDKAFTKETAQVLPQVTLHTSGSPDVLNDVHPYSHQIAAQVYGSIFAEQTIEDFAVGSVTTQQVRYYARRFGDTTSNLELYRASALTTPIASLSPAEFDELEPENGIIDGWKEITLDLDVPQSFSGTRPAFRWVASNETAGNRWEILAMLAAAISGSASNTYLAAPAQYALGTATYGYALSGVSAVSNGANDALKWLQVPPSFGVSAMPSSVDPTADAVLMFAVTPQPVTGFAISELTQALTGVAVDDCAADQCCIPTGIQYNQLTWSAGVIDSFLGEAISGSWGTSDNGVTWQSAGGNATWVSDGIAYNQVIAGGSAIQDVILAGFPDQEIYYETMASTYATTNQAVHAGMLRWSASDSYYIGQVYFGASGVLQLDITRRLPGGFVTVQPKRTVGLYAPGEWLSVRFQAVGAYLRLKVWPRGTEEPGWQVVAVDTLITSGSFAGIRTELDSGFTPSPWNAAYDNLCIYPAALADGGYYEMQRMDDLTDWQTIMRASPCSWYMNDYEARVGIESTYRIRMVDGLNFAGSWSSEVSNELTAPGVTGGACLDGNGVLIFTSNYAQSGIYNLAYTESFEAGGVISEDFSFPEAGTVQLQRVYQRDFPVAFKGTERGGEQFARVILVHNAAVDPVRLADMQDLRDMAWAQLPYVCVRDEIGDRWFALVTVPGAAVRRNRQLYFASVTVSEVTDTAFPIDPVTNA